MGEDHPDREPRTRFRIHPHRPAVVLDDRVADEQTEPRGVRSLAGAEERVHHLLEGRLVNAGTIVGDDQLEGVDDRVDVPVEP